MTAQDLFPTVGAPVPWYRRRMTAVIVLVVAAILVVAAPLMSSPYINYLLAMIGVYGVAILGLNVIMGWTGQVSLGQSFFIGLGAYTAAYGVQNDWPIILTFLAACIGPAVVGLLVALAAARLKGLALAMVTITLPIVGIPLAKRFSDITGGSDGMTVNFAAAPEWTGLADDQWRYYIVALIAVACFVVVHNLTRGRYGRAFAIVRDNSSVATSMGVSSYRYKVLAFTVASLLGGCSGFLYMVVVQFTSPETMNFGVSINLVAAMVIGGSASILGSLLGGVYYVLVPYIAGQIGGGSGASIASGVILLVVLFILPGGLVSAPKKLRALWQRRHGGSGRLHPTEADGAMGAPENPASSRSNQSAQK